MRSRSALSNLGERRWQKIAGDRVLVINREMQAEVEAELDVMRRQEVYLSGALELFSPRT